LLQFSLLQKKNLHHQLILFTKWWYIMVLQDTPQFWNGEIVYAAIVNGTEDKSPE